MKKNKLLPIVFIFLAWLVLFRPFWLRGLLPMPADIIAGLYYPWLDYKWGFAVGVPVKNPLLSDIPSLLYPWRSFAIDQIKGFEWPLWNPYYFAGMPLLANPQSAVFSYVNLFFTFLPKFISWSLGVMISPLLTMIFTYLFLRRKKLKVVPCLLGSLVFSLSGFEIAWLEYNVHGHTAMFLPLVLLALDKIFEDKKRLWFFLLPLIMAAQIFTGYLPIVIYTYLISGFYFLSLYLLPQIKKRKVEWGQLSKLILVGALGFLMASIQIFPTFELFKSSIRKIDPIVEASNASYLKTENLITLLAPDYFGNPATGNYFGRGFYDNFYFYIGTGTLLMVIFSLFFLRKEKEIFFWWSIFIFSLILVFNNSLGRLLEKLFFLSGGVAARALFITDFSLAILSALGMEAFIKTEKQKKKMFFSFGLLAIFFYTAYRFSAGIPLLINRLVARRNLILPVSFFSFSCLLLSIDIFLKEKDKWIKQVIPLLFLFLVAINLFYSAGKYLPFSKKDLVFPQTPVIEFLESKKKESTEPFRVELGDVIPQNLLMPYKLETVSGSDALLPRRMGEFLSLVETGRIQDRISRVQLIKNYNSLQFPLLNIRYILAKKQDEKGYFRPEGKPPDIFLDKRYNLVFEDKTVQIYEDKKFLPRAFWVYDYEIAGNSNLMVQRLNSGLDFSKKVILEEDPKVKISKNQIVSREIVWQALRPGKIQLEVKSDQPGLIYLANNFDPDWEARVDGVEQKIFRANYTFQAIPVLQGQHQVQILYKPRSFELGLLTSVGALTVWTLAVGICLLKKSVKF